MNVYVYNRYFTSFACYSYCAPTQDTRMYTDSAESFSAGFLQCATLFPLLFMSLMVGGNATDRLCAVYVYPYECVTDKECD